MKKIVLLAFFLFGFLFLEPFGFERVFAYQGGLLEGEIFSGNISNPSFMTDGDLSSNATVVYASGTKYSYAIHEFEVPVNLEGFYFNYSNTFFDVSFYDVNNTIIYHERIGPGIEMSGYHPLSLENVKKI
ncbi:hypothetical protein J9303_13885, partial [Bacillaceae bacterium Marseille-Q3522]|nr:hypothetical protein [Bacillaceae bacterium Marseille-Q3522]